MGVLGALNEHFDEARAAVDSYDVSTQRLFKMEVAMKGCGAILLFASTVTLAASVTATSEIIRDAANQENVYQLDDVVMTGLTPLSVPLGGLAMYGAAGFASIGGAANRRRQELQGE